jgi:hypothetical protein
MPSNVARFEQLMYLSIGIGIALSCLQYGSLSQKDDVTFALIIQLFVFAVLVILVWLIARRQENWARWVLVIMFLAGLLFYIPILSQTLNTSPLLGILSIIRDFIQGIALYLVFTGNAVAWFRAVQGPSKGSHP